jgi:hypothetical protein
MYTLTVLFPIWVIDYETYRGKGHSFSIDFGPFDSEQQAKWFWLTMKEKMNRKYEIAVIHSNSKEVYVDDPSNH